MEILDQKQRELALDPGRSFIVQAPAGSGKTELLVKRFLNLLGHVERPEHVLAITFTKKAAAEMRRRVLASLPPARAAELAHRLRIQTIDALCASLTRQMPVLARFGAQPRVAEDPGELYREAAARTLERLTPQVERLLAHLDNDVGLATRMLADLLRSRDRWLRKTGAAPTREELEAAFSLERERLLAAAKSLHPKASEEWAREVLTKSFTWRKNNPEAQALADNEPLRAALEALCKMPPASYEPRQWAVLEAILALLLPAVSQLKVLFGEAGEADFTEFAHGALAALGAAEDPSELLLALDRRLSHILVDEFQDTSVSQFELLARLTAGWQPGDGRTLFVVGDPMQSIYRFREAEVSLFLKAKNEGVGSVRLESLVLQTNFRSQAGLVEWFNAAFPRVLPQAEDEVSGAVPYSPAAAKEPELPGTAVAWHGFYDRAVEARKVISLLENREGKAAILVRNRAHLDEIVPALKEAGIRFRAVEIEQLGEKQAVQDLFALTRAMTHLGDRVAALAVLRAPWCGLLLQDIDLLCENAPRDALISDLMRDLSRLSPDGQARAARVREVLGAAWQDRQRGTLRDAVEGAWLALGGPACVADATELEDAEVYLDELERLEQAGAVDFSALIAKMGELFALPDVEAGEDAVEIMTIHKAKGLEFDTVIVPGLDRTPRAGPRPLFAWKTVADGRLLLAPIMEVGSDDDQARRAYEYIRELNREAEDIEAGRLFYVAATRAKKRLHLLAVCRPDEEAGGPRAPFYRSLLAKVWWQAAERFGPAPDAQAEAPRVPPRDVLRRLRAGFALPAVPKGVSFKAQEEAGEEPPIEFSWAQETARQVGIVAHRWLQRMAEDGLAGWDAARIASLERRFAVELAHRGVPQTELGHSTNLVVNALRNAIEDERGRWVLGPHADAKSEYRMRVFADGEFRTCVMDRVFRDAGKLWIVDYKTSRHEGAGVEGFLDREQERYRAQMKAYGDVMQSENLGLYFPLLKGWREWNR